MLGPSVVLLGPAARVMLTVPDLGFAQEGDDEPMSMKV